MPHSILPFAAYREKVLGCWLGKAVGGTLGGPVEGRPGPLHLSYYDPVPERMLPNDDLDLQVVWLETIRRRGLPIDRRLLADAWLAHVLLLPDEYGVACRNLAWGIYPPASGSYDSGFTAGMGAAIRTELWACLAPGDPNLAAVLAREDACVDHAGEGVWAAIFLATLESAAFLESDREALLDRAEAAIPSDSRVARAVGDARRWWREMADWRAVRERLLAEHGRQNFTDVAQNLAFVVLGWLAGGGDFGTAISTAVNCGADTDCTGATLGALLGIIDPASIGAEWLKPIGRDLVLSPGMVAAHHAATLDDFTDRVATLAADVLRFYSSGVVIADAPTRHAGRAIGTEPRQVGPEGIMLAPDAAATESLLATEPLVVTLVYPPDVALRPGEPAELALRLYNPTGDDLGIWLSARPPDGWTIAPGEFHLPLRVGAPETIRLTVAPPADAIRRAPSTLDLRFKARGLRWCVTAGLVVTTPWLRWAAAGSTESCPEPPDDATLVEAASHYLPLIDGFHAYRAEFKLPHAFTARYVVQAPREVQVWLGGNLVIRHGGRYLVPAFHRPGDTGRDVTLESGWHRLTIFVGDGSGGELFVGIGDGETWGWLRGVEWRVPTVGG